MGNKKAKPLLFHDIKFYMSEFDPNIFLLLLEKYAFVFVAFKEKILKNWWFVFPQISFQMNRCTCHFIIFS